MPSLLRRLTRISFRSEMLIINLLGLVNSTLDWVPLKWSSEVESVGSLPLTKESFAFNTISADRIRSILTWIVLLKVLVDNLYTVSYLSNIYSVITWSRPLLLIPWILFSFFKNFILEVLIFAIGILLAFEERLPLFLLVEFVIVKVVQFNLASYTWYRNTRLYLFLKCRDKLLKIHKGVRSLSMATNGFNYSARSRSRSLSTVKSYDSSSINGLSTSTSRIYDAPDLTPREKAMKVLNVSEQDIREAKNRRRRQFPDVPSTSSTHMDVPSTVVSSGLAQSNEVQCSSAIPSTARGRSAGKRVEDKTGSFYFFETPLDLPLDVSNMPLWSERVHPSAGEHQTAEKSVEVTEAPEHQSKEDSTAGMSKERSRSRTTIFSFVGKPEISAQEPICKLSIAHVDNAPSSNKVTLSSAEMPDKPCASIMKKKEQKYCSAKSGIGECSIGKCTIPQKNSQADSKNLAQDNNPATYTRNKEPHNVDEQVDADNRHRSDELKEINSTVFFDANDISFTVTEGECDDELSENGLRAKRKLGSNKDQKWEEPRKIQKVEECSNTPTPEDSPTVGTTEDNTNGTDNSQMSENCKCEHVVPTSAHSIISEPEPSDSKTSEVLADDIVITQSVTTDFENALITRKTTYEMFIKSEESDQSQTELQRFKSPNTKPRKTYYSQQQNRPTFYTSPKRQARKNENQSAPLRICRRKLSRDSNVLNNLNNNQIQIHLDSQSSSSSNITIRSDRQKKDSGVLKPRSENTGPSPLTETTRTLNYKNVTIRNPLPTVPVRSSHSINSMVEQTKDKDSNNEIRKQLASSGVSGTYSSAGRAARFKQVKALRGYTEISLARNRKDSVLCQQNDDSLLQTGSLIESRDPGIHDHWDKENIYSHAPFKEPVKPMHPILYTGTSNIVPHKSQNVILMTSQGLDDMLRPSSTRKGTEELQEAEVRRRLTKFSASKEEEGESSISAVCSKKIEGQQEGKDLVRILAKEDVRNDVAPGTSASTSRDPPIERPTHYQTAIIDKFRCSENSAMSENSSSVVNSVAMDSEVDDTTFSMSESAEINFSNGEMNSTLTASTNISKSASFDDEACFSGSIDNIRDRVNDVLKTLDRLESKTNRINMEEKNKHNDETGQVGQVSPSIDAWTAKICGKQEFKASQIDDRHSLKTSPIVMDQAEDTNQKNEEIHTAVGVDEPESSTEILDSGKSDLINKSDSDNASPRSAVLLEKVLGIAEYNNTDLPYQTVTEKQIQPEILKIDHVETSDKPHAESTEEVKNEWEPEALSTIPILSEVLSEGLPKSEYIAIERPDEDVAETETAWIPLNEDKDVAETETARLPLHEDEDVAETETARIPLNEEQEELTEVVDTSNVPQPRLPITTIALFFILVIHFYFSYFYRNILKPVFTYTLSSIFLTIFSLVARPRTNRSIPSTELSVIEEEVELSESEHGDMLQMKSDLLPSEGKSEVEEAADTEKAVSSVTEEQEPMGTDNEPANSTNAEDRITDKEVDGSMCDMNQTNDLNVFRNPIYLKYRTTARDDESDVEDSFRALKTFNSLSEMFIPLNDSVQVNGSDRDGQEVSAQMANMIKDVHLSDSEASTGTIQSNSGEDTVSLGQGSSFEEFPKDSTPQAESQV